ncbi:MAG: hypothetical protein AAGU19_10970 [Prolixibacteraceae bacterium]
MNATLSQTLMIFAVLTVFQNYAPAGTKLIADETARKIFSPEELNGIGKMISFVDSLIVDQTKLEDINEAYHAYFSIDEFYPGLVKDSVKFKFLETVGKEAFDAIWTMSDSAKLVHYKGTTLVDLHGFKTLGLNYRGKYRSYMKEVGKTDSLHAVLNDAIEVAGDIPPSVYASFFEDHKKLNFSLFKDRLWTTVFILSMGDPLEERVERYLRGKNSKH